MGYITDLSGIDQVETLREQSNRVHSMLSLINKYLLSLTPNRSTTDHTVRLEHESYCAVMRTCLGIVSGVANDLTEIREDMDDESEARA